MASQQTTQTGAGSIIYGAKKLGSVEAALAAQKKAQTGTGGGAIQYGGRKNRPKDFGPARHATQAAAANAQSIAREESRAAGKPVAPLGTKPVDTLAMLSWGDVQKRAKGLGLKSSGMKRDQIERLIHESQGTVEYVEEAPAVPAGEPGDAPAGGDTEETAEEGADGGADEPVITEEDLDKPSSD